MTTSLDRTTFRRMVQLYLWSVGLLVVAAIWESLSPSYAAFSADFDAMHTKHFGELSDTQLVVLGIPVIIGGAAHIVAGFALLRFRGWARWLFWAPILLTVPLGLIPSLGAYWTGYWTGWLTFLGSALFGMILLLAYSRDHGAIWFAADAQTIEENSNG